MKNEIIIKCFENNCYLFAAQKHDISLLHTFSCALLIKMKSPVRAVDPLNNIGNRWKKKTATHTKVTRCIKKIIHSTLQWRKKKMKINKKRSDLFVCKTVLHTDKHERKPKPMILESDTKWTNETSNIEIYRCWNHKLITLAPRLEWLTVIFEYTPKFKNYTKYKNHFVKEKMLIVLQSFFFFFFFSFLLRLLFLHSNTKFVINTHISKLNFLFFFVHLLWLDSSDFAYVHRTSHKRTLYYYYSERRKSENDFANLQKFETNFTVQSKRIAIQNRSWIETAKSFRGTQK